VGADGGGGLDEGVEMLAIKVLPVQVGL